MLLKCLVVFFISMLPIIELRGALPFAMVEEFMGVAVPTVPAYIICILGNMIPVPFIYFFARKILLWGADKKYIGKFFRFCLTKGEHAGQKLMKKGKKGGLVLALMLFVGIPIPGTGAWTGTLAASFLDMGFKKTTFAVSMGVILAGVIIAVLMACGINILDM